MRKGEAHKSCIRFLELIILVGLPVFLHYLLPVQTVVSKPYTYWGAVIMIAGLFLAVWTASQFRKTGTAYSLQKGTTVLLLSGPYQFSRHPMYLGMLLWLTGLAVFLGSLIAFLFPLLFFLLANFLIIPMEERNMEQRYGVHYSGYKKYTRRWL